jgi:DNA-directed RNA polymerase specialized sigma24 family protein
MYLFDYARIAVKSLRLEPFDEEDCISTAVLAAIEEDFQKEKKAYVVWRMKCRMLDWLRRENRQHFGEEVESNSVDFFDVINKLSSFPREQETLNILLSENTIKDAAKKLGCCELTMYRRVHDLRRILSD